MLTLTRKPGECIRLGNNIVIYVKEIRAGAVKLGFEAPKEVKIYREELFKKIFGKSINPNEGVEDVPLGL